MISLLDCHRAVRFGFESEDMPEVPRSLDETMCVVPVALHEAFYEDGMDQDSGAHICSAFLKSSKIPKFEQALTLPPTFIAPPQQPMWT